MRLSMETARARLSALFLTVLCLLKSDTLNLYSSLFGNPQVELGMEATNGSLWDGKEHELAIANCCIPDLVLEGVDFMSDINWKALKVVFDGIMQITKIVDHVQRNKEELQLLLQRCTYVVNRIIAKCRNSDTAIDINRLQGCVNAVLDVAKQVDKGKWHWIFFWQARSIQRKIEALKGRLQQVNGDETLVCVAAVEAQNRQLLTKIVSPFGRDPFDSFSTVAPKSPQAQNVFVWPGQSAAAVVR